MKCQIVEYGQSFRVIVLKSFFDWFECIKVYQYFFIYLFFKNIKNYLYKK